MIRTAIALLGLAAILAYLGLRQWEVRARAADTPVGLSLRELLTRGPGENTHVALSGFDYCDRFAYAEKRVGSGWSAAFFPIVPAGERTAAALGQETARVGAANADEANRAGVALSGGQGRLHGKPSLPGKIGVIIVSKRLQNDSEVAEFIARPSIQGLVVDPSESLNRYERGELQGRFPTLDLSKCVVIEEGRAPPGRWLVALLFGGSGAALAFAGGLCVAAWRKTARLSPPARSQADSPSQVEDWMRAQGKRV
jgi:hypothetical protein